jgi:RNA polymerase sigma factor (sigma-70 family)
MNTPTATARPARSTNAWMRGRTKTIPTGLDPRLQADINAVGILSRDEERALTTGIVSAVLACWDACLGVHPTAAQRHSIYTDAVLALGKSIAEDAEAPSADPFTLTAPTPTTKTQRRRAPSANTGPAMQTDNVAESLTALVPHDLNWSALRAAQTSAGIFATVTAAAVEWRRALTATAAHLDRLVSKMTAANMRLVMHIAKKERAGLPYADLVQEGSTGLLKAIRRFDPSRGFTFATFASHWIRADIGRANDDKSELIRRPVHILDAAPKVTAARIALAKTLGREPSVQEIAEVVGRSAEIVAAALGPINVRSADETMRVGQRKRVDTLSATPAIDTIEDADLPSPIDLIERRAAEVFIERAVQRLKPQEQDVIRQRYADENGAEKTLVAIGLAMTPPLSRERIRQIEASACARIRDMAQNIEDARAARIAATRGRRRAAATCPGWWVQSDKGAEFRSLQQWAQVSP